MIGRPTVSVVVPAHGRPKYLRDCLASIAAQTLLPDEVIVCQDGLDVAVSAVAVEAGVQLVVNDPPLGQLANRNQAMKLATGAIVSMLDDDDRLEPEFLEVMVSSLTDHPECDFCSADHWIMDAAGNVLPDVSDISTKRFGRATLSDGIHRNVLELELRAQPFPIQFSAFRRSTLERAGFFPQYADTAPDFGLFLELGIRGTPCLYTSRRLGAYRIHPGQQIAQRGRARNAASRVACLSALASRTPKAQRPLLAAKYRAAIVEQVVALAHLGRHREALHVFRRVFRLGFGPLPVARVAVMCALLAGARPSRASPMSENLL